MRLPRLFAPGHVQLVQVRFVPVLAYRSLDQELRSLLDLIAGWLGEQARASRLTLHAWSLSPSQLLLLTTPPDSEAVASTVQAIGRRLAPQLKVGSVFEGRYKSTLVDPEWVLRVQAWVESAPANDGYATQADAWPWSSAAGHAGIEGIARRWVVSVSDHESYWRFGNTPFDRQANYRAKLAQALAASDRQRIEAAISGQWALGSDQYLEQIARIASRRVVPGKRGRPAKASQHDDDPSPI